MSLTPEQLKVLETTKEPGFIERWNAILEKQSMPKKRKGRGGKKC